jgi:bile acid:Na+ symporter, BASS family
MSPNLFSHYLLPIAIAYIMFGIGINLNLSDFRETFKKPKAIIVGLIAQMVLLPIVAFILNMFFDYGPIYKAGLVLIAICPGGTTSNLVTFFLKGRLALSVALTSINSFLIIFTIPVIMHFTLKMYEGFDTKISLPVWATIANMFSTVLLPTIVGMLFRHYFPKFIARHEHFINLSMTVFLLFVFAGVFIFENAGTTEEMSEYAFLFLPAFLLNLISMFVGYFFARIFNIDNYSRFTIAIQVGLQNSALAIFVASKLLGQAEMALVAIIYASFTLFTTTLWAWLMKKYL